MTTAGWWRRPAGYAVAVAAGIVVTGCAPERHAHRVGAFGAPPATTMTGARARAGANHDATLPETIGVAGGVREPDAAAFVDIERPSAEVEAAVLAAYFRARDADRRAYLALDPAPFDGVYAGAALASRRDEIEQRRREGRPMQVAMEFHPAVTMLTGTVAAVDDDVRNHSVRLDPATRQPVEPVPDEVLQDTFTLEWRAGQWVVVLTARVG